jgi:acyl carrier protein
MEKTENRRDVIKQRLNEIFREVFEDDTINIFDEMTAKDIDEWDSLTHIILVVAVEKEFGIRLNAAEVGKLENVGGMLNILSERATK